jgi:hypothetical protein
MLIRLLRGGRAHKLVKPTAGRVAEWLKAPDSKSGVVARLPWVRIPPLPPLSVLHFIYKVLSCFRVERISKIYVK